MILTPEQMTAAEQYAVKCGTSLAELMDNAGFELSREVRKIAYNKMKKIVLILCGRGNNGGDGFVCANHLLEDGLDVTVALVCGEPKTQLAKDAFSKLSPQIKVICDNFASEAEKADIIVDAVFGTGFHGELPESVAEVFRVAEKTISIKIACDIPSGVNCLTGVVSEETMTFDKTVTFHAVKLGSVIKPAKAFCGEIIVAEIGIPDSYEEYCKYKIENADLTFPENVLPKRRADGHKGTFGKLLMVCGSKQYRGAAVLSTSAAIRSGAGLVEVFSEKEVIDGMFGLVPEAIYTEIELSAPEKTAEIILEKSKKASAILIGCGMGDTEENTMLVEKLVKESEVPIIIDADGINSISRNIDVLSDAKAQVILTPHPAELSRICGVSVKEAVENRLGLAVDSALKYGAVVMAKGAGTFITDGRKVMLANFGNTALSKGGSGDILAGITASFIAQGAIPLNGATAASIVLGATAEMLSETASERGIVGSDIISALPYAFKKLNI